MTNELSREDKLWLVISAIHDLYPKAKKDGGFGYENKVFENFISSIPDGDFKLLLSLNIGGMTRGHYITMRNRVREKLISSDII